MKKILFGCLAGLLVCSAANAQQANVQNKPAPLPPAWYVDLQRVNFQNIYMDVNNISNIDVQKGICPDKGTNGCIFVTLKVPLTSFLTLEAISRQQADLKNRKVLYMIDDNVVMDTSGVRIEPSYIAGVRTVNVASIPYAGGSGENLAILIIKTKKPAPVKSEGQQIMIRGAVATK